LENPAIGRGVGRVAVLFAVTLAALPLPARSHHSESWARQHFAAAERMREALNGRPPDQRTRRAYQGVIGAYRTVYYGAPTSTKADPSVVAVAETMVEMGRRFQSEKVLNDAIGQYKFLRREYPGSKYRFDALFTIAEVYKDDLNDPVNAQATFQDFLHRYPRNRLADDARSALTELDQAAKADKRGTNSKSAKSSGIAQSSKDSLKSEAAPKAVKPGQAEAAEAAADAGSEEAEAATAGGDPHQLARVTGIRHWSTPDYTRVAIDVESEVKFGSRRIDNPDRIFFDLRGTRLASTLVGKTLDIDDGFLKKIRVAQFAPGRTRVVLEVDSLSSYNAFLLPDPYRLIIDIHGKGSRKTKATDDAAAVNTPAKSADDVVADITKPGESDRKPADASLVAKSATAPKKVVVVNGGDEAEEDVQAATVQTAPSVAAGKTPHEDVADDSSGDQALPPAGQASRDSKPALRSSLKAGKATDPETREARPMAAGDRSLIRALGLKIGRIVIDPGHGGHDTGTIGPNGLEEKNLVVDVGRRLGKLLETRMGADVVYTRKDDTFIPLETRTAIANRERADLFISIHANSSRDASARGVETYYLNFTSSPEALEVAARENAVSDKSIHELQDLVKKIALKSKIDESREFASDVEESLHSGLASKSPAIRDRGVKKAPFIVLIGANMPSILAEISFVSNPTDEKRLETGEYRQKIAESLYRGIAKYVSGLSGVKVASRMDKVAGQ